MGLYEDLGVEKGAPSEEIKRAYRKQAQKAHPDKPGGDVAKFRALTRAYEVLSDDARRAHYDTHGVYGQQDRKGILTQRMALLFINLVERSPDGVDLFVVMREHLAQGKAQTEASIRTNEQSIAKYERVKKRVKKAGGGENLFSAMLDGQIAHFKRGIENGKTEVENFTEMVKMLEGYSCSSEGQFTFQSLMNMAAAQEFGLRR